MGGGCKQARRSGWVRAWLYKKAEHNTEALSEVGVCNRVWYLLGFSAWLGAQWSSGQFWLFSFSHLKATGRWGIAICHNNNAYSSKLTFNDLGSDETIQVGIWRVVSTALLSSFEQEHVVAKSGVSSCGKGRAKQFTSCNKTCHVRSSRAPSLHQ